METKDIITLSVSILALLGSIFTYFAHSKRLNKQQEQINDFQLTRLQKEKEDSKKADLVGSIIPSLSRGQVNSVEPGYYSLGMEDIPGRHIEKNLH